MAVHSSDRRVCHFPLLEHVRAVDATHLVDMARYSRAPDHFRLDCIVWYKYRSQTRRVEGGDIQGGNDSHRSLHGPLDTDLPVDGDPFLSPAVPLDYSKDPYSQGTQASQGRAC